MNDHLARDTEAALERALGAEQPSVRQVPRTSDIALASNDGHPLSIPENHLATAQPKPERQPLEVLYDLLNQPADSVPRVGVDASAMMAGVFDKVSEDIMRVAQDAKDRADALYQEAANFVTVVQESKRVICGDIEDEARRAAQVGIALRETAKILRAPRRQG